MKYFLLIGHIEYSHEEWIGCFETYEEANEYSKVLHHDGYEIVDLRRWISGEFGCKGT